MKPQLTITRNNILFPGPDSSQKNANESSFHPDQKYIDALLKNDRVVLEELYQKFSGKIKSMVIQNNGTVSDAAIIFQEALLMTYQMARTKNFVLTCSLEELFYLVCKNKWMNNPGKSKVA